MKKQLSALVLGCVLAIQVNLALAEDAAETLIELLNGLETFQAHFSQVSYDEQGRRLQETQGSMAVKQPGLLYWQALPPYEQIILSDGARLTVYDPDLEQVTIQALDMRMSQTPALLLSGSAEQLASAYEVEMEDRDDATRRFILTPMDQDSVFEYLVLSFAADALERMEMHDALGQTTLMVFSNIKVNEHIDPRVFQFTPPPGVDVIEQ